MLPLTLLLLICIASSDAYTTKDSRRRMTMLAESGRSRKRVVNSNEISNIFRKDSTTKTQIQVTEVEATYYDDEEDELDVSESNVFKSMMSSQNGPSSPSNFNSNDDDNQSDDTEVEISSSSDEVFSQEDAEKGIFDDDYFNLADPLEKSRSRSISKDFTLSTEKDDLFLNKEDTPRVFQYEPIEKANIDPMVYGAYRRSKIPVIPPKGSKKSGRNKKSNTKNKDGSTTDNNSFYNAIKNLGSGPVPKGGSSTTGFAEPPAGRKPITPKKAPTERNRRRIVTPDEINSLFVKGSKDDTSNTNKNKGNSRENNPLFMMDNEDDSQGKFADNGLTNPDYDYEEDDNNDEQDSNPLSSFTDNLKNTFNSMSKSVSANVETRDKNDDNLFTSSSSSSENAISMMDSATSSPQNRNDFGGNMQNPQDIPEWLVKADKDAEKKRKAALAKNKRKKQLTDDWRFWAAMIVSVGFATAFFQMYQQTGGFSPDISPFGSIDILNNGGNGLTGSGGGDELII